MLIPGKSSYFEKRQALFLESGPLEITFSMLADFLCGLVLKLHTWLVGDGDLRMRILRKSSFIEKTAGAFMVDHGMPTGGRMLLASWPRQSITIRFQSVAAIQLARRWGQPIGQ